MISAVGQGMVFVGDQHDSPLPERNEAEHCCIYELFLRFVRCFCASFGEGTHQLQGCFGEDEEQGTLFEGKSFEEIRERFQGRDGILTGVQHGNRVWVRINQADVRWKFEYSQADGWKCYRNGNRFIEILPREVGDVLHEWDQEVQEVQEEPEVSSLPPITLQMLAEQVQMRSAHQSFDYTFNKVKWRISFKEKSGTVIVTLQHDSDSSQRLLLTCRQDGAVSRWESNRSNVEDSLDEVLQQRPSQRSRECWGEILNEGIVQRMGSLESRFLAEDRGRLTVNRLFLARFPERVLEWAIRCNEFFFMNERGFGQGIRRDFLTELLNGLFDRAAYRYLQISRGMIELSNEGNRVIGEKNSQKFFRNVGRFLAKCIENQVVMRPCLPFRYWESFEKSYNFQTTHGQATWICEMLGKLAAEEIIEIYPGFREAFQAYAKTGNKPRLTEEQQGVIREYLENAEVDGIQVSEDCFEALVEACIIPSFHSAITAYLAIKENVRQERLQKSIKEIQRDAYDREALGALIRGRDECASWLRTWINGASDEQIERFLQWSTGAIGMPTAIYIMYVQSVNAGLGAHACINTVDVHPSVDTYELFVSLLEADIREIRSTTS